MAFELPPLPWPKDALAPTMSAETIDYHYGKHHKTYVDNLNKFAPGTKYENMSLEEVIKASYNQPSEKKFFNNSAQVWNHTFFWESMKPNGGGAPPEGPVADLINGLGGYEKFKTDFIQAGLTQFGSGWAWLVLADGKGKIVKTPNAETPLTTTDVPLLVADVWEHAYYLDHRNNRKGFLEAFLDKLVNWDFVAKNLAGAK